MTTAVPAPLAAMDCDWTHWLTPVTGSVCGVPGALPGPNSTTAGREATLVHAASEVVAVRRAGASSEPSTEGSPSTIGAGAPNGAASDGRALRRRRVVL